MVRRMVTAVLVQHSLLSQGKDIRVSREDAGQSISAWRRALRVRPANDSALTVITHSSSLCLSFAAMIV